MKRTISGSVKLLSIVVLFVSAIAWTACGTSNNSKTTTTPTGSMSGPTYAYVYDAAGSTFTVFTVNADGSLTATSASPIKAASGAGAGEVVVGSTLWTATSHPDQLVSYTINADGTLTQEAITSLPATGKLFVAGNFLYQPSYLGTIQGFQPQAGGAVTALPAYKDPAGPVWNIAVAPGNKILYASIGTSTGDVIQELTINSDGSLTATGAAVPVGSPLASSVGRGPVGTTLLVDSTNRFVYAASPVGTTIRSFAVGAGGALTLAGTLKVAAPPTNMATDGSSVYVATTSTDVYSIAVGSGGTLTLQQTMTGPMAPAMDAVVHGGILYVDYYDPGSIAAWTISTGNLTPLPGMPFQGPGFAFGNPMTIVFSK